MYTRRSSGANLDPEEICTQFTHILRVDERLTEAVKKLKTFEDVLIFHVTGLKENESEHDPVLMVGSTVEGTGLCRSLGQDAPCLERDIMYGLAACTNDLAEHILVKKPDHAGHYTLPCTSQRFYEVFVGDKFRSSIKDYFTSDPNKTHFQACDVVALFHRIEKRELRFVTLFIQTIVRCMEGKQNIPCYFEKKCHGPALTWIHEYFHLNGDPLLLYHMDRVFGLYLKFWPEEANEWLTRNRKWPPTNVIEQVRDRGVHLIAKNNSVDWRLSFSASEQIINCNRGPNRSICFFIAKTIYYMYIRYKFTIDDDYLTSYPLKTVMLWIQEEKEENDWKYENLEANLKAIFSRLAVGLTNHKIDNYFLPEMNVLESYSAKLTSSAATKASEIAENPLHFAAESLSNSQKVLTRYNSFNRIIEFVAILSQFSFISAWSATKDRKHLKKVKCKFISFVLRMLLFCCKCRIIQMVMIRCFISKLPWFRNRVSDCKMIPMNYQSHEQIPELETFCVNHGFVDDDYNCAMSDM